MRAEFSKPTKREALRRSGHKCEASGAFYGLPEGQRCEANLAYGVQFDHVLACSNGGDASLGNCLAICTKCHKHKTTKYDTPRAAKSQRISDKHNGIREPSRGFRRPPGTRHNWRTGRTERIGEAND
jgi:5-methylcytosine-specific restriction endonuclease McrA